MTSIISWNVNGIRAAEKKGFLEWLHSESPDILCLQETKARKEQLSAELTAPAQRNGVYHTYWQSAKKAGYSGTALFCKQEPLQVRTLGLSDFDDEGRVLVADFDDFSVISAYFPNSQEAGARLSYKLAFCDAIFAFCNEFEKNGKNVILCGDYNIAHKPIDLANPKSNEKNPGYLPEERAWMDSFLDAGYVDTFRSFCPEPEHYTWWSYRFHAREKNIGWRIDYHCVNQQFKSRVIDAAILKEVYGSDHCPIRIHVQ
ncbi:MAG: exodeoxyribonuclease III [Treponema sp.]